VLGLVLFLLYINDIEDVLVNKILQFVDDTKLFSIVSGQQDIIRLQTDLQNFSSRSKDWPMFFYIVKYRV
jgi:hypothetical protein